MLTYLHSNSATQTNITVYKNDLIDQKKILFNNLNSLQSKDNYIFFSALILGISGLLILTGLGFLIYDIVDKYKTTHKVDYDPLELQPKNTTASFVAALSLCLGALAAIASTILVKLNTNVEFASMDETKKNELLNKLSADYFEFASKQTELTDVNTRVNNIKEFLSKLPGLCGVSTEQELLQMLDTLSNVDVSSNPASRTISKDNIRMLRRLWTNYELYEFTGKLNSIDNILNVLKQFKIITAEEIPVESKDKVQFVSSKIKDLNDKLANIKPELQDIYKIVNKTSEASSDILVLLNTYATKLPEFQSQLDTNNPKNQATVNAFKQLYSTYIGNVSIETFTSIINSLFDSLSSFPSIQTALTNNTTLDITKFNEDIISFQSAQQTATQLYAAKQQENNAIHSAMEGLNSTKVDLQNQTQVAIKDISDLNSIKTNLNTIVQNKSDLDTNIAYFNSLNSLLAVKNLSDLAKTSQGVASYEAAFEKFVHYIDFIGAFQQSYGSTLSQLTGVANPQSVGLLNLSLQWFNLAARLWSTILFSVDSTSSADYENMFGIYVTPTSSVKYNGNADGTHDLRQLNKIINVFKNLQRICTDLWDNQEAVDFFNYQYGTASGAKGCIEEQCQNVLADYVSQAILPALGANPTIKDLNKRLMRVATNFHRFFDCGQVPYEAYPTDYIGFCDSFTVPTYITDATVANTLYTLYATPEFLRFYSRGGFFMNVVRNDPNGTYRSTYVDTRDDRIKQYQFTKNQTFQHPTLDYQKTQLRVCPTSNNITTVSQFNSSSNIVVKNTNLLNVTDHSILSCLAYSYGMHTNGDLGDISLQNMLISYRNLSLKGTTNTGFGLFIKNDGYHICPWTNANSNVVTGGANISKRFVSIKKNGLTSSNFSQASYFPVDTAFVNSNNNINHYAYTTTNYYGNECGNDIFTQSTKLDRVATGKTFTFGSTNKVLSTFLQDVPGVVNYRFAKLTNLTNFFDAFLSKCKTILDKRLSYLISNAPAINNTATIATLKNFGVLSLLDNRVICPGFHSKNVTPLGRTWFNNAVEIAVYPSVSGSTIISAHLLDPSDIYGKNANTSLLKYIGPINVTNVSKINYIDSSRALYSSVSVFTGAKFPNLQCIYYYKDTAAGTWARLNDNSLPEDPVFALDQFSIRYDSGVPFSISPFSSRYELQKYIYDGQITNTNSAWTEGNIT